MTGDVRAKTELCINRLIKQIYFMGYVYLGRVWYGVRAHLRACKYLENFATDRDQPSDTDL